MPSFRLIQVGKSLQYSSRLIHMKSNHWLTDQELIPLAYLYSIRDDAEAVNVDLFILSVLEVKPRKI